MFWKTAISGYFSDPSFLLSSVAAIPALAFRNEVVSCHFTLTVQSASTVSIPKYRRQ